MQYNNNRYYEPSHAFRPVAENELCRHVTGFVQMCMCIHSSVQSSTPISITHPSENASIRPANHYRSIHQFIHNLPKHALMRYLSRHPFANRLSTTYLPSQPWHFALTHYI